jgi:hypothetical protein
MTTLADLQDAYNATLVGAATVCSSGQANDAFEIYVLTLALRASREEGAEIQFVSASGIINPSVLRFRTAPGRIYTSAKDYTHVLLSFSQGLTRPISVCTSRVWLAFCMSVTLRS